GLGEAWKADQQCVTAAQHGDERLFDDLILAKNDRADRLFGSDEMLGRRLGSPHDHVFQFLQAVAGRCRHKAYSSKVPGTYPSPCLQEPDRNPPPQTGLACLCSQVYAIL